MMNEKIEAWKVKYLGSTYITQEYESAIAEIKEMEVGESARISRIIITRKKFDALKEFTGF